VALWRRVRRLFSNNVEAIVGLQRVFGTDSECLDDGVQSVEELVASVGRIVREHLLLERARALQEDRRWFVRFSAAGREWRTWFEPRDYGPVFALVNEALHHARAPRRVHVVSSRRGGQDFRVAFAAVEDVAELLAAGWIVEAALPNVPHVLEHDGLRFHGDRPYRLSDRGTVIEAVLSERQEVRGIPCAAGESVSIDYEGSLVSATLAEDVVLGRWTFRAGSRVTFWEGTERVPCEVALAEDHEIAGVPCAAGTTVTFREDGSLESATLSRVHAYRGREIARGSTLWFDERGAIESVDEPSPAEGQ